MKRNICLFKILNNIKCKIEMKQYIKIKKFRVIFFTKSNSANRIFVYNYSIYWYMIWIQQKIMIDTSIIKELSKGNLYRKI